VLVNEQDVTKEATQGFGCGSQWADFFLF